MLLLSLRCAHDAASVCDGLMGLLSILKKEKQKRRELRLLFV